MLASVLLVTSLLTPADTLGLPARSAMLCSEPAPGVASATWIVPIEDGLVASGPEPAWNTECLARWLPEIRSALIIRPDSTGPGGMFELMTTQRGEWLRVRPIVPNRRLISPRISMGPISILGGRFIFSAEDESGNRDVYMLHMRTNWLQRITESAALDEGPVADQSGEYFAFMSQQSGNGDIYHYRVGDPAISQLTATPEREAHPLPVGDSVFFLRETADSRQLVLRRISVDWERVVDSGVAEQPASRSADGRFMCWAVEVDGDTEIRVLDLESGAPFLPVPSPAREANCQWDPSSSGELWFESDRTGDTEVFRWRASDGSLENMSRSAGHDHLIGFAIRR